MNNGFDFPSFDSDQWHNYVDINLNLSIIMWQKINNKNNGRSNTTNGHTNIV